MRTASTIERLATLGAQQEGRVSRAQLNLCGIDNTTISRWVKAGRLIPRLPRVFALAYVASGQGSRLWEAVLFAGPGAMVSHMTAAQWRGYVKYAPLALHVSTPTQRASVPNLVVHNQRRHLQRDFHQGVPVTRPAQTIIDLASVRPDLVPRALGQMDYQHQLDRAAFDAALGTGVPVTKLVRAALEDYDPAYAQLNDEFEIDFYELCRGWGIDPLPLPNVEVAPKLIVDGLWPEQHLAVELDGRDNHSSDGQLLRDAERDLICRSLGLTVIRYRRAQIKRTPDAVHHDLQSQLDSRAPRSMAA